VIRIDKTFDETTMTDGDYLRALQRYWKRHRAFPAMARICGLVGLSSTSSVFALVSRLSTAGYLQRVDGRIAPGPRFFDRPFLGPVRAGVPQLATQEEPEALSLDDYLIDQPERTTLHRVRGDSMIEAHIAEGDLVVVEHHTPPRAGDIVLAVVDGGLTVKTLAVGASGEYFLRAANPAYPDIHPASGLEVLGVVVSIARRLRSTR
jgi:repressor LexA